MHRLYPWLAILLLSGAFALRIAQWDLRPFHADEAVQAYQTWRLLNGEGYRYDPADKHGPSLYYGTAATAKVLGWSKSNLNEKHFRSIPLVGGLTMLVLFLAWHKRLGGKSTALLTVAILSVAPLPVLYATYFVQEAWFAAFSWLLLSATCNYAKSPSARSAVVVGFWAGAMQVTKETSILHFAAIAIAIAILFRSSFLSAAINRLVHLRNALIALGCAAFVYALFYSSFFKNPAGLWDGVQTYFHYAKRAEGAGHSAPWHAYVDIWLPHMREGIRWGELGLLAAAVLGIIFLVRNKNNTPTFLRAGVLFSGVLLIIYSAIPYKTPWLMLTPYAGVALLAGYGLTQFWKAQSSSMGRMAAAILVTVTLGELVWRERRALHRFAGDARVPYFYQQTSPQFPEIINNLEKLRHASGVESPKVLVCSPDHAWPLPWYLKDWKYVGYHSEVPDARPYDIILVDSRIPDEKQRALLGKLPAEPYGLRPNVLLWLATKPAFAPSVGGHE